MEIIDGIWRDLLWTQSMQIYYFPEYPKMQHSHEFHAVHIQHLHHRAYLLSNLFMIVLTKSIKDITSFISERKSPFEITQPRYLQDWKFVMQSKRQSQIRHDFGPVNASTGGVRGFELLKDFPGDDWRYLFLREEFGKKSGWNIKSMVNLETKLRCYLALSTVKFAVQFLTITRFIRFLVTFY